MQRSEGVSIIVPIHGRNIHFPLALQSILDQKYNLDQEIILALDRPGEDVIRFIEKTTIPNVRVVSVTTGGVANAHNAGLFEAKYSLTAVMHADDVMMPNRIQSQADYLRKHAEVVCVGGQITIIDDENQIVGTSYFPESAKMIRRTVAYRTPVAHPAVMYRTAAVQQLGGYRQDYAPAEDYDLWARLLEYGEIANLSTFVLKYRRHDKQTSQQEKRAQSTKYALVVCNIRNHKNLESADSPKNSQHIQERYVRLDVALHKMAKHRLEKKWFRIPFDVLKAISVDSRGTVVYALLYFVGRWKLRLIQMRSSR
jgi:GT2 family glycosyltransferase